MPVALVGTERYPRSADLRHPAIDANGTLVLGADDGASPARLAVRGVAPFHQGGDGDLAEFNSFGGHGIASLTWTISLTDSRVLFSAPEVVGMYGGVKTKSGRMTAGQLKYEWLGELVWGFDVLWLLTPLTKTRSQERVGVVWDDSLVSELASRLVRNWHGRSQGRCRVMARRAVAMSSSTRSGPAASSLSADSAGPHR